MKEKVLSVSIAAYNVSLFLSKLMDSLCANETIIDELDIMIINDGSTDDTLDVASVYCEKYPQSIRIINKENGGHGSTINTGIKNAKGKYFRPIDGDDWVDVQGFLTYIKELGKVNVDMVLTDYNQCFEDGLTKKIKATSYDSNTFVDFEDHNGIVNISYHTVTYRTQILKERNKPLDEHCFYADAEYIAFYLPEIVKINYIPCVVYCYRLGLNGQSVSAEGRMRHIDDSKCIARSLLLFYNGIPENVSHTAKEKVGEITTGICISHITALLLFKTNNNHKKEIIKFDNYVKTTNYIIWRNMGNRSFPVKILRLSMYLAYPFMSLAKDFVEKRKHETNKNC